MKICQDCGQLLGEEMPKCPSCGAEVIEGRKFIDDYRILAILHEGYSSILCKAIKTDAEQPVMIRIFTLQSGVDEKIAARLIYELEELKSLPEQFFVRHLEIRKASNELWYRVSEWVEGENWGTFLSAGRLKDYGVAFRLFSKIARILEGLHRIGHFIPHLILDDIIIEKGRVTDFNVKIDYKLSRFLDPNMDRPGPMLKKLLDCHPDIINQRPLDYRSDIWSVGKVFIELLTADHEAGDFKAKVDELPLPENAAVLFKTMLADDPDLRPRSMAEVAETLSKITEKEIKSAHVRHLRRTPPATREIVTLKKRVRVIAAVVAVLVFSGIWAWFHLTFEKDVRDRTLGDYADEYAGSVAFVVAEYWLKDDAREYYRNRIEGTAFLVDREGYLVTNRHVSCPWLEDATLYTITSQFLAFKQPLDFGYRLFLWFEGAQAFRRLPDMQETFEIEDVYAIESAYRTDGLPSLSIVGVARPPIRTLQKLQSPLRDDFGILKIDRVPENLLPIPLAGDMETRKIPRLSPVMALGFPLGSRTQESTVNVSVTTGHVRRTFPNLIQVDTSIYKGNSGGPIIDKRGLVIGIASRVAVDWATAPVPVATYLSDIGMVLPITKVAGFLQELKAGQIKWNGVLDLSIDAKLKQIVELARKGQWREAAEKANEKLKTSLDPRLVMAAGVMHFCAGNYSNARRFFQQALSMDKENNDAKMMFFLIDWAEDRWEQNPHGQELMDLDWRSPYEFFGHLVRILSDAVDVESASGGGYTNPERTWLCYLAGLVMEKRGRLSEAEQYIRKAVLSADIESWVYHLAAAGLGSIQGHHLAAMKNGVEKYGYRIDVKNFAGTLAQSYTAKEQDKARLYLLNAKLEADTTSIPEKIKTLEQILTRDAEDGEILLQLAFYSAVEEDWKQALAFTRRVIAIKGREGWGGRLKAGILEGEILHAMDRREEAKNRLKDFVRYTGDPWYREIGECLLAERLEQDLLEKAGNSPHYLLTAHAALGFWAESTDEAGNVKMALRHYQEAIRSYLDEWPEYDFALARIQRLRKVLGQPSR